MAGSEAFAAEPAWRIVIVNFRTCELAVESARAALEAAGSQGEVVVVDSHSEDHSSQRLSQLPGVRLCALDRNRGYAAALNAGAEGSRSEWLLCLNADVRIPSGLFEIMERRFRRLPRLALIGPRLLGETGRIQPSCRRFPTHASLLASRGSPFFHWLPGLRRRYIVAEPAAFTLCDVVAGACFAVRMSAWREVGGMDDSFFLYAEDTDLCLRLKSGGWLVAYDPLLAVRHLWGESRRRLDGGTARLHAESLGKYLRKHYPQRKFSNRLLSALIGLGARVPFGNGKGAKG